MVVNILSRMCRWFQNIPLLGLRRKVLLFNDLVWRMNYWYSFRVYHIKTKTKTKKKISENERQNRTKNKIKIIKKSYFQISIYSVYSYKYFPSHL